MSDLCEFVKNVPIRYISKHFSVDCQISLAILVVVF